MCARQEINPTLTRLILTAVHNFYILRPDETTAAERLFGRAPPPLFEQLLERVPLPPRPRRRRPRAPKVPYLTPIAARAGWTGF